jgi:hypothetical protein
LSSRSIVSSSASARSLNVTSFIRLGSEHPPNHSCRTGPGIYSTG